MSRNGPIRRSRGRGAQRYNKGWVRALLLMMALGAGACGGSLAPLGDGGADSDMLLPFGTACTTNAQCQSNICFVGGNRSFCTMHCTTATAAQDCPKPPTSGTCNMQGYCKP